MTLTLLFYYSGFELFVNNIDFETTANEVVNQFRKCGFISHWYFPRKDPKQVNYGKHKGFGFIYFAHFEAHQRALKMKENPPIFNGRTLRINSNIYYKPDDDPFGNPRSREQSDLVIQK